MAETDGVSGIGTAHTDGELRERERERERKRERGRKREKEREGQIEREGGGLSLIYIR